MLKALMLRKRVDLKKKEMEGLRTKMNDLEKREADLEKAIDEVNTEEEQSAVQEEVDKLTEEKEKLQESVDELDKIISDLETELDAVEAEQNTEPGADPATAPIYDEPEERSNVNMKKRVSNVVMTIRDRLAEHGAGNVAAVQYGVDLCHELRLHFLGSNGIIAVNADEDGV